MSVKLRQGDMLQVIPQLVAEGVVVDAVVTDPPYHLTATVKRFGAANSAPAQYGRDGAMVRLSGGFMSQQWDGGDIAFRPETWATVAAVMRPGAFLLAFGGTRTYHRLACAIEDAGFVIQDCLMWLFATGFPKRRDMLKPAFEPIVMAYKPGGKRELQIDECRIGTESTRRTNYADIGYHGGLKAPEYKTGGTGRWPANVLHDGSDEVVGMFPQSAGQQGDIRGNEPSATGDNGIYGHFDRIGFGARNDSGSAARFFFSAKAGELDRWATTRQDVTISWSSGPGQCQVRLLVATVLSPARVIAASESGAEQEWNTFLFGNGLTALFQKACRSTIKMTTNSTTELKTWNWLTRSLTSDFIPVVISAAESGSSHADHADITRVSISFILDETASMPNARYAPSGGLLTISAEENRVGHPTVKPIALMKWLVQLVTPPNGTVLDCFAGTGTTGIAATVAGRNAILIERELSYCADIRERLVFYEGGGAHSVKTKNRNRKVDHGPLFAEAAE